LPDESPAPPATLTAPRTRRVWVMIACLMAIFMAAVESTIVSTAMPTIVGLLGGLDLLSWVFAAYLLSQAVTIPIYGRLADLYGRKRVLMIGSAIFLAGSALCGFARSMPALVAYRALQGLGAGAILPIATTIIGDLYEPEERGRVGGYMSSIFGVAALVGPLLGAFLVQEVGWATVFWINLPVGAAAILLLAATLHEHALPRPHSIDYLGSVLMMLSSGALILALVQANQLGRDAMLTLLAIAALALAALLLHERRAVEPMMPLDLWRHRVLAAINIGGLAMGTVMMAIVVFLPTYVQGVMGRSAVIAGFALTAMSLGWPIAATIVGWVIARSSYRAMAVACGVSLVAGSALLAAMEPTSGPLWAGSGAFLIGVGLGFGNTTYVVAAQSSVDWRRRGIATSMSLFMRMLGQSVGAGLFGGILNAALARRLPEAGDAVEQLMAPARRADLGAETIGRLSEAVAQSLHQVFLVATLLAVVTLALALLLPAGIGPRDGASE
jgi:EmrB/QacA subfamily drug resistance transporter